MPTPTKRRDGVENEILLRLGKGEPLAVICRSDPRFPCPSTWGDWVNNDEALAIAYARAREIGFDAIAADCLAIADETGSDTKINSNGDRVPDSEWISRSKLRVETRLKLLAKWDPKRYGDATMLKHADADGEKLEREIDDVTRFTRLAAMAAERQRNGDLPAGDE